MKWWREHVAFEQEFGEKQLSNRKLGFATSVIGEQEALLQIRIIKSFRNGTLNKNGDITCVG
jgi:hypothetical protein